MKDFVKHGGTYEDYLWKMYYHVAHVKLLGNRELVDKLYEWAEEKGSFLFEGDYSEKYQPTYD